MIIKVARLGTPVVEIALDDGASVATALDAAGLVVENEEIRVNQTTAALTTVLYNGNIVTLVPKVKGGQRIIKVARLGTPVREVAIPENATVRDALDASGIDIESNEEVRLDNASVSLDSRVGSAMLVTIVPKVKGGK